MAAAHPDLAGKAVLITGGGSGIGAALTRAFHRQGAKTAFIDIAEDVSRALAGELETETGRKPLWIKADLADIAALKAAAAEAEAAHGPAGVLVNNAALDDRHTVENVTEAFWDANQAVNLRPHFFTAQAVLPGMKRLGGGSIINFTSTAHMLNIGDFPSYTAAKGGIIGLTKGLAGAFGPHGVRVNAIAPGWVMTERQKRLWVTEEGKKAFLERQCLKEMIEPEDMAGPCLFLASEDSRMMTAQVMIVDAGLL